MKKQPAKSKVFTKESLQQIQDEMRNCCIRSYNRVYEKSAILKQKQLGRNQDINVNEIRYLKAEIYEKFDTMPKEVDEEYRTTLINFAKYKLVMFTIAKIMEMTEFERNKVTLYLINNII